MPRAFIESLCITGHGNTVARTNCHYFRAFDDDHRTGNFPRGVMARSTKIARAVMKAGIIPYWRLTRSASGEQRWGGREPRPPGKRTGRKQLS